MAATKKKKTRTRRTGIETRSWTSGPYSIADRALWGLFAGGTTSDSGVVVTREAALSLSAIWKGVNIIANGCAKAGLHRYRRLGEHGKERDSGHPTYNLVRSRPNEYMTAFVFWRTIIAHAILEGNGYAAIERNRGGTPMSLLLLDPSVTYPVRRDGVLWYVTSVDFGDRRETVKLAPEDVLHVAGLGYDGLCGYSLISIARDVLGGAIATRKHSTSFFKSGARPGGVIEAPGFIEQTAIDALRDQWERLHTGVDNANRTAILTNGMQFKAMTIDAQKSQMVESQQLNYIELANLLLLPSYLLGDDARVSYNSVEMEQKAIADHAFDPWWTVIETECDRKLLTAAEQREDAAFFRWNRRAILQTDPKAEAERLKLEVDTGLCTPDEARGLLDRAPLPHGLGNIIFRPQSNQIAIDLSRPPVDTDDNLDFQRELVKIFAADGTISDVVFNLTDAQALLEAVNIPVFAGYDEPWLPVMADNGQPVTGEVLLDGEGDIVGGVAEEPEPEPPPGDDGNGPFDDGDDDTSSRNDPKKALKGLLRREKRRKMREMRAILAVASDALERMVGRICDRLYQRKNMNLRFVEYAESLEKEHGSAFEAAFSPIVRLIAAQGGDGGPVRGLFFSEMRGALLTASECRPDELAARVKTVEAVARRSCRKLAAMAVLSGVKR